MQSAAIAIQTASLIVSLSACVGVYGADHAVPLHPALEKYIAARTTEFALIPGERKEQLAQIAQFVSTRTKSRQPVKLTFVCTHNSRRSHLAQIWAQVAAIHFGLPDVRTFSGGAEITAFNPRAIAALRRAGFDISNPEPSAASNPHYQVRYHSAAPPLECFSKTYSPGSAQRLAIPYDDPKAFDDTPAEAEKYDERSQQIAREMLYIFSKAKEQLE